MIESLNNKTVKELVKLHQKKYREDSFLLFDKNSIATSYQLGLIKLLVYVNNNPYEDIKSMQVSDEVMHKISKRDDIDYLAVCLKVEEKKVYSDRIVILDHVQDPLNIGKIMEVSQLFGFDSLFLSKECADIYHEKCLDNCEGGIFNLNICEVDILDEINNLKKLNYQVYATGLNDDTKDMYDVEEADKVAIILGNEGSGVDKKIMEAADETIKIAMDNIDSLNVAMAASIVLYHFSISHQR